MCTREIITLQIGHYSNFIGTHWWNNQESSFCYDPEPNSELFEINHDVLFRQGQNPRGEVTYTPRLVAVDLKSNLNSLKKDGILYNMPPSTSSSPIWQGKLCTFKSEVSSRNEFLQDLSKEEDAIYPDISLKMATIDEDRDICQAESSTNLSDGGTFYFPKKFYNLDESVHVWSDFLRIHLHPRSLCLIEEYNQEDMFSLYGCGLESYDREDFHDALDDSIRYFAEECDFLQGFHILMDGHNGFTAVGNSILEHLVDNYSNKARLSFPVYSPSYKLWQRRKMASKEIPQLINCMLGYSGATTYSSLFAPLFVNCTGKKTALPDQDFPFLIYNSELPYHTSAILSLALDTSTLLTRLKTGSLLLSEITNGLSIVGRKLVALSLCGPLPIQENHYLDDILRGENSMKLTSVSPLCEINDLGVIAQFTVLRGVPETRFYSGNSRNMKVPIETLLALYLKNAYPHSMNFCKVIQESCRTSTPFPHIFDCKITQQGYVGRMDRPKDEGVERISALGGYHNVNSAMESLNLMIELNHSAKLQKSSLSIHSGIEYDDFQEAVENVKMLAECYKDS